MTRTILNEVHQNLAAKLLAEFIGTAFLLAGVVGSGIAAETLSPNDTGLQLFQNSFATAGILVAIILAFGAVSGAHFNPAVTIMNWALGGMNFAATAAYVATQTGAGILGVILANLMFDLSAITWSTKPRSSPALWLAEVVATFGLLIIIAGVVRSKNPNAVAFAVAAYIAGAYYFTSSTSFANPAVTIARTFSDTFAGIEPASAPGFIAAQFVGTGLAIAATKALWPKDDPLAD